MKVTLVPENFQILDQFPMHLTHFVSRPDYERLIEGINNHLKPVKRANSKQTKQVAVALVLIPFTCGLSALSTICIGSTLTKALNTAGGRIRTLCDEFNVQYRTYGVTVEYEFAVIGITGAGDSTTVYRQHRVTFTVPDIFIPPPQASIELRPEPMSGNTTRNSGPPTAATHEISKASRTRLTKNPIGGSESGVEAAENDSLVTSAV